MWRYFFDIYIDKILDGSLRVDTSLEVAKIQNITLPTEDLKKLKYLMEVPEDCKTLQEYLKRFDLAIMLL
ncbi:hypothetical protein [Clostridium sp. DL1XJH146]